MVERSNIGFNLLQFLGVVLRLIGFVFVGAFIALTLSAILFGLSPTKIAGNVPLSNKEFVLTLQGLNQLFSFIILPLLYLKYIKKDVPSIYRANWDKFGSYAFYAVLIMLFSIPLITILIELNKSIHLPEFLRGTEAWMQQKEEEAKQLTELIAYVNNPKEFIIGLIVIALLPAIGEELVFRGIIQNEFRQITKNPHVAIWLAGFIFSFMHFQFYGFFARMMLGVTFGYLYFWSGNLIIPILVHFLNNALTFILLNLYKNKMIDLDPESSESFPLVSIIISFVIFGILLVTFKKIGMKEDHSSRSDNDAA